MFFALQVDATIMYPLSEEEQFVFSERANASNQEGQVRLTVLDRIYHIRNLRTLRLTLFDTSVIVTQSQTRGLMFARIFAKGITC
jgi:hypothetical protein